MKKICLILSVVFLASVSGFAQQTCATAVTIGAGIHTAPIKAGGNMIGCGTNAGVDAVWYEFTPVCDGVMTIDSRQVTFPQNTGNSWRNRITLRTGGCAAPVCGVNGQNGFLNSVSVVGGTAYLIEFDDSWSSGNNDLNNAFDFSLDFTVSNAPTPLVTTALVNSAFALWTPFGLETGWDIQYGPTGFSLGTGTTVNVDSAAPGNQYEITGLLPETEYCYYISIENTGCWVGPICFTTDPLCSPPSDVQGNPLCNAMILSWVVYIPGGYTATWDMQFGPLGTALNDTNMIFDGNLAATAYNAQNLPTCTDFHVYVREVCDAAANPPLVSAWTGPVTVSTACCCPEPTDLNASADPSDPFNYFLDWTAGGAETQWNVQWGAVGFIFGTGTIVPAGTNPFTLTGVTPNTTIEYYLQADCGTDGNSNWVGPFTFTSNQFCPAPTGLGANTVTTTGANLFWNVSGTSSNYTIQYGTPGFNLGSGTTHSLQSTNAQLQNLIPDTEYCYYVQSNCGATQDSSSAWAGPFCFTTVAGCPEPTVLQVNNLSFTSATFNWQPGATETTWDVEWGFPGFIAGTGEEQGSGTSNTTSDFYATGLNSAAPYCFYVRAVCGGLDGNSIWTGPFCFETPLINDLPCGAIELLTDGSINIHTNEGATVNGENAIAPPLSQVLSTHTTDCTWWDDTWFNNGVDAPVWFKFKAPASGKVEVSTMNEISQAELTYMEVAVYEVGDCNLMSNFSFLCANSFANIDQIDFSLTGNVQTNQTAHTPGAKVLLCDLTPGTYYYIMADHIAENTLANIFNAGVFGISVSDIPTPYAGVSMPLSVCSDGSQVNLFDAIDNNSVNNGTWYSPNALNPGLVLPGTSPNISFPSGTGVYSFDYVIANACGADTVSTTVTTNQAPNAGLDGYFSNCNTSDILLINHLQGQADLGGYWSDANNVHDVSLGVFEAYGEQYGTYSFNYIVQGTGGCPNDTAVVNINLNNGCLGIDDAGKSSLEIYPNPVNNILTITNLSIDGNATVVVYDAQGKMIISHDISNHGGNFTIDMTAFEVGMYVIEVNTETSSEKVRVIKQ